MGSSQPVPGPYRDRVLAAHSALPKNEMEKRPLEKKTLWGRTPHKIGKDPQSCEVLPLRQGPRKYRVVRRAMIPAPKLGV